MVATIRLTNGTEVTAQGVFGGKEEYQGFLREYLELTFPQEGHTVSLQDYTLSKLRRISGVS